MALNDKYWAAEPAVPPPPLHLESANNEAASENCATKQTTHLSVSKYLKGKEREWREVSERGRPLDLLELPVDILNLIVKEARPTRAPHLLLPKSPLMSCC